MATSSPQTRNPCWAEAKDHVLEPVSSPFCPAPCLQSSAGSAGAGDTCARRGDHHAVGPQASAAPGSLVQDAGLSGQFCRCPRQPRHRSGSRWVDWAQEGARRSLSSTQPDSQACGPILNCPDVPAQEAVPWQGPTLQQTQRPCQVQAVLGDRSPQGGLSAFSIWCACAHQLLALSQKRPRDACMDPADA